MITPKWPTPASPRMLRDPAETGASRAFRLVRSDAVAQCRDGYRRGRLCARRTLCGGVVVESNHHGPYHGDPRLDPFYAELNSHKAAMFIHPTSPSWDGCDVPALGYP